MTESLKKSINEKDVENIYRHTFLKKFKDMEITSPFGCDGFGVSKSSKLRVLMEFKDDLNLSSKMEQAKVLAQSVFYIKKFYDKGIVPPSTIFIGDRNECLTLHVNDVIKYLDMDLDWSSAPSAASKNIELMGKLINDTNINPFVFDSNHFEQCVDKVKDLTDNVQRKVLVTDKNITEVFRYFENKVLGKCDLTTNQRANLFVQILVNSEENYLHPSKKRKSIVTKSFGEIFVKSREGFESFFAHFASSYSPSQKHKLSAVVDRLVEDVTRRKQGEFFTPAIWVDKAHEYIASVYGEDWKEKYVVWDPAWGTGNLTRDYKFKELYVSTLIQSDIDTANQMKYNPEAVKFQYDFLNDDYDKLPKRLRDAIESGREIIVLMNPPYATAGVRGNNSEHKSGVSDTMINREMKEKSWGNSSQNLYAQFLFRIFKINIFNNFKICVFSPPLFMSGSGYKKFRIEFFKKFGFEKGFLFQASNFSDVSDDWSITFSIWGNKNSKLNKFEHDILHINDLNLFDTEIKFKDIKKVYNTDNVISSNEWVKDESTIKTKIFTMKSALQLGNKEKHVIQDMIMELITHNNNCKANNQQVYFLSRPSNNDNGRSVTRRNVFKSTALFTARRIIYGNWINWYDEYLAPNEEHEQYEQFKYDSLVYSLFESKSNQSSLRQVTYKDKLWDIKNEFFWMSVDEMKQLADDNGYDGLYNDARTSPNRHVYNLLFGEERIYDKLSPDAKLVLDKASELVRKSIQARQLMSDNENHLDSWDAGYAQLKLVWKEYFSEEFKEFRQMYKNLEDRMRPLVYELGFLMK